MREVVNQAGREGGWLRGGYHWNALSFVVAPGASAAHFEHE